MEDFIHRELDFNPGLLIIEFGGFGGFFWMTSMNGSNINNIHLFRCLFVLLFKEILWINMGCMNDQPLVHDNQPVVAIECCC